MRYFISPSGCKVRLTDERLRHICQRHPEVEPYLRQFQAVFDAPEFYQQRPDESVVARKVNGLYLVIYFRESVATDKSFVLTAHLMSKIHKLFT